MTNEQKAQRLERQAVWKEGIAHTAAQDDGNGKERSAELLIDAALLRECGGMMRERGPDDAMWKARYERRYKRHDLCVYESRPGKWAWRVVYACCVVPSASGEADSLAAAQAAAIAWVDEHEGKDV